MFVETVRMKVLFRFVLPVVAMGLVILASNKLVQYPVQASLWGLDLGGLLTWGAFTYPAAFLVTDTTNRIYGVGSARKVVYVGFVFGLVLTITVALGIADHNRAPGTALIKSLFEDESASEMFRIACASGTAFLIAQLLDIQIFDRLRQLQWWKAPVASSFLGSLVDTITFFFLAFAGTGLPWASWALGDFGAKLVMIAVLLYPFKLLVTLIARGTRSA